MRRPMLGVWVAFGCGALVAEALPGTLAAPLLGGCAVLLGLGVVAREGRAAVVAVFAAAASLGLGSAAVERQVYEASSLREWARGDSAVWPVWVVGRAARDGSLRAGRLVLLVDVESIRFAGRVRDVAGRARISVGGQTPLPTVAHGDRLALWARLGPPRGYRSPGARDARVGARRARIHAWGRCKNALLLEWRSAPGTPGPVVLAARLRAWARLRLGAVLPEGAERVIVRSMVLGDRGDLDAETLEAFRAAGTYHVLALSGAQVAMVAGLLLAGLRRAGVGPVAVAAIVVPGVGFYALLVGGDVPVVRAAAMTAVLLVGRILDQRADAGNLLGVCGLVLLAERPTAAAEAGYQLSFLATLALVLLTERFARWLPGLPLGLHWLLGASLAAQLALMPLLVATFHRFSPLAPLTNLVAVPLSGGVLLAGVALLVADVALPLVAGPAAFVARWLAAGLLASARLAAATGLDPRLPDPPLWSLILTAGALVALARGRRWSQAGGPLAAGLLGLVAGSPGPVADGRLHVSVLDVGQGESILVRTPSGGVAVIDTGARYPSGHDLAREVVAPYLWNLGARRIDRLVLTHVQRDHVGGVDFLLRSFAVGALWVPPGTPGGRTLAVGDAGASRRSVARGTRENWGAVRVAVLGPRGASVPQLSVNDRSVVLSLQLGNVGVLLSGDVERRGEAELAVGPHLVVKVPHHGSRSSSGPEFVRALGARLALVSCGAANPFGHPAAEVLERYASAGAQVHRTDREGSLTLSTDGRRVWIRTASAPRARRIL